MKNNDKLINQTKKKHFFLRSKLSQRNKQIQKINKEGPTCAKQEASNQETKCREQMCNYILLYSEENLAFENKGGLEPPSSGGSPIESAYNVGETVLIPGSGRSPGGGNSNPLQYSCWENPMNRRASWLVGCNLWGCKTLNTTEYMHAHMHVYIINKIFILIRIIQVPVCMPRHFSRVQLFATLWTVAHQAPLNMGFSRQEYWSELPYPPPGSIPNPGMEPKSLRSPRQTAGFFTTYLENG